MEMNFESLKSGSGKVMASTKAVSDILISNTEKMLNLQMESRKVYSDVAFTQLNKMSGIQTIEQAGNFFWGQIEPLGAVNKQLLCDWKSLMVFNSEFTEELRAVFSSGASSEKSDPVKSVVTAVAETTAEVKKPKARRKNKATTE